VSHPPDGEVRDSTTVTTLSTGTTAQGAGRAERPPLLVQGLSSAVVGGVLALAALPGAPLLALVVLVAQLLLVLGLLALAETPGDVGVAVIGALAAVAADVLALTGDGGVDRFAGVVALALVGALLHQLVRRERVRVTESLAGTLFAVVLVICAACLVALRRQPGGDEAVVVGLVAVAVALLAGRLGDRVSATPLLAPEVTRGWPGLLLGLLAGAAAAAVVAGTTGDVDGPRGAVLGLVVAATAALADLAVDVAAVELTDDRRDARRVAALRPVATLLPYAVIGPVLLVAGRLVLG